MTTVVDAGGLSCYTAALGRYLERAYDDPLTRMARSIRIAVRDLPGDLLAFSHHRVSLADLGGGRELAYRGASTADALLTSLERELSAEGLVIVVAHTGAMPWSIASASAPHFLLVSAHRDGSWQVEDAFSAMLPTGVQEPYRGWIRTERLIEAVTPPPRPAPEHRLRKEHVFGFAVPLPPDGEYQWLGPRRTAGGSGGLGPGWRTDPAEVLGRLADYWSDLRAHPDRVRHADDMWASAQHHAFRYAHLTLTRDLAAGERRAAAEAREAWANLPMALRFAADSAARGRERAAMVRATFDRLRRVESDTADVLARHGYS